MGITPRSHQANLPLHGLVFSVSLTEEEAHRAGTSLDRIAQALRFQLSAMLPTASTKFSYMVAAPERARRAASQSVIRRLPAENGLVIDLQRGQARVDGEVLQLSQREFDVLRALIDSRSEPLSRSDLFDKVLGPASTPNPRSVDVIIHRLRGRLGTHGAVIRTVRGLGYRFDPLPGVTVLGAPPTELRRAS